METINKKIAGIILNSLQSGVVPKVGTEYIMVGRKLEGGALLNDLNIISEGGANLRFIVGKYGSGKSFLMHFFGNEAREQGFIVLDVDLSPEKRLMGSGKQGLNTYRELIRNMSSKTTPEGGALPLILEKWISNIQSEVEEENKNNNEDGINSNTVLFNSLVESKISKTIAGIQGMVHGFDFSKIIKTYFRAYNEDNDDKKQAAMKWLRGEFNNKFEAKNELGVSTIITNDDWYEYLKLFSYFLVSAGYKGMIIIIDEMVNLCKLPSSVSRQQNYEKILTMFNDTMQGNASYLEIIFGATPQSMDDDRKGIFSYDALRSRLEKSKFVRQGIEDMMAPVIRIEPLANEELFVLIENLAGIHAHLYNYKINFTEEDLKEFLALETSRIGAAEDITPREIIRDFIQILNISFQHPELKVKDIIGDKAFNYSPSTVANDNINDEFKDFNL